MYIILKYSLEKTITASELKKISYVPFRIPKNTVILHQNLT